MTPTVEPDELAGFDPLDVFGFAGVAAVGPMPLSGFSVEALDGSIGKVDEASNDVSASYIVSTPARGSSARK